MHIMIGMMVLITAVIAWGAGNGNSVMTIRQYYTTVTRGAVAGMHWWSFTTVFWARGLRVFSRPLCWGQSKLGHYAHKISDMVVSQVS